METTKGLAEIVKQLREARAWSQEHLAQITDLSVRTIQRIEGGSEASPESLMALASAFDLSVQELKTLADYFNLPEDQKSRIDREIRSIQTFPRMRNGNELLAVVGGAHAITLDNEPLKSKEEASLVGTFLQLMHDYMDIWDDIAPLNRASAEIEISTEIEALEIGGFSVFAGRRPQQWTWAGGDRATLSVAYVLVFRSDNKSIVRGPNGAESIPVKLSPQSTIAGDRQNGSEKASV